MALFCAVTGVQPSEYLRLTVRQINAFTSLANERAEKQKGSS